MMFVCVWGQDVSHIGEIGGAELCIFEQDAEDGPAIYARTFVRPLSRIGADERLWHERRAKIEARRLLEGAAR